SSNILTTMINSNKMDVGNIVAEATKVAKVPMPSDTEFFWTDGQNNIVKVNFLNNLPVKNSLSESELGGIVVRIMMEAQLGLKNKLSFTPTILMIRERIKTDKLLTDEDNTTHVAQLNYSGTNSFGGMVENLYMIGFSPKLDLAQSDKNLLQSDYGKDVNKEEFRYEKTIVNGLSMNDLKGSIIIGENYVITIMDKTDYTGIIEGEAMIEKIYQDENNWTASISIDYMGGKQTIKWTYQGNNQKYKTNAGVLIYEGLGSVIEYPLNRVEK